jgi:glycosyltransferase involved in cell wall biosynthesis
MRLTLINQFYPPELAPTGHMAASIAEHRAANGDQVTVVTGSGGYVAESGLTLPGVPANLKVIRLWTPRLGKTRAITRILDYAFFYALAGLRMLTLPRQDVIVSLTTPPLIAWTAVLHAWIHRSTRLVLWNMDCYPEIAEQTGVFTSGGFISRLLRILNRQLFKRLDHVICLDQAMQDILQTSYADQQPKPAFSIIPNWEPLEQFPPDLEPPPWADAPPFPSNDPFVVLYLGNAGFGHRFETVIEAAKRLREEPFVFLFVGGGQQWPWLAEAAREHALENILLHPYIPKESTPSVMALADCALITLRDRALGLISPSKLHANLAMSLPVIYIGPERSNVDTALSEFGFGLSLRHGEDEQLADYLRRLRSDSSLHARLRATARKAFDSAFNDSRTLPLFDRIFSDLAAPR